jgi:hypothetical protein
LGRRRQENLDKGILALGIMLIIIAIILGAMQHFYFSPNNQSLYGGDENKYYFYGLVAIIGLIGIILVAWSYMKKKKP